MYKPYSLMYKPLRTAAFYVQFDVQAATGLQLMYKPLQG